MARAITDEAFGAWLLKRSSRTWDVVAWVAAGPGHRQEWCVQPSYRSARMRAGDPVVLWVSGSARSEPAAGVWGLGRLRGPATTPAIAGKPVVPVDVAMLGLLLTRVQARQDPVLQGMEVLRQPSMGNPGWLTVPEWDRLQHVVVAARGGAPGRVRPPVPGSPP